jgi:hypothetical protein
MSSSSARTIYETIRNPGPRVRLAAKLYAKGIARTKKEACSMAGCHPSYLTLMRDNEVIRRIHAESERQLDIATGDINIILQTLGREGLNTINELRQRSSSEAIQLKAAIDLADRSPETSKIQKHQLQSISLEGEDVSRLIAGMVEAAKVQKEFEHVHSGSFNKTISAGNDTEVG